MLEEGGEELLTVVFRYQRPGDLVSQVSDILGDEVGHFSIFGMAPTVLDHVQFRRIGG